MIKNTDDYQRTLLIEEVFDSWAEYQDYYLEACRIHSSSSKRKRGVEKNIIKKYFEIEFKSSIKAPRYYYPEESESIVLQIPSNGIKTRARGEKRLKLLTQHQHVVGATEMHMRDLIAMKMKLMNVKVPKRRLKK